MAKPTTAEAMSQPSSSVSISGNGTANTSRTIPRSRCGACDGCRSPECGQCNECRRKKKFGGDGTSKQACTRRRCVNLHERATSTSTSSTGNTTHASTSGAYGSSNVVPTRTPSSNGQNIGSTLLSSSLTTTTSSIGKNGNHVNNNIPASAFKVQQQQQQPQHQYHPGGINYKRPASLLGDRSLLKRTRITIPTTPDIPNHICGINIPEPILGVCGNCGTEEGRDGGGGGNDAVLLCDGKECGKEFHLKCCLPPLMEIPEGDFHCFDCSLKGSTSQLEQYFADFEKRRIEHGNRIGHWLLREDLKAEYGIGKGGKYGTIEYDTSASTKTTEKRKMKPPGIPRSELDHSEPNVFLGKPIRLYCPNGNHYHSGRIVDVRPCYDDDDDDDDGDGDDNGVRKEEGGGDVGKNINLDTFCLVRFAAGKDHRKTPFLQWLRLEEHCVVVGIKLLWAQFPPYSKKGKQRQRNSSSSSVTSCSKSNSTMTGCKWARGILWSRSARELVCVMKEAEGTQILYDTTTGSPCGNKRQQLHGREWGLIEDISRFGGTDCYSVLRLDEDTKETISKQQQQQIDQESKIVAAVVQAELAEQERVRNWHKLPLENSMHSHALRNQDEYTLGTLEYKILPANRHQPIEPSPAIPQGLDRSYILKKLAGIQPSKDLASSLVCKL